MPKPNKASPSPRTQLALLGRTSKNNCNYIPTISARGPPCRSRMVHLDRENGAILLPDGSVVPYDVLVLCTGLQVCLDSCGGAPSRSYPTS